MDIKIITKKVTKILKSVSYKYVDKNFIEMQELHKFKNDDVTNLDILVQDIIKSKCMNLIKNSGFIGEENIEINGKECQWILDPIDGTVNLKHGIKNFGTQICLLKGNNPIISALYLPNEKQMFVANEHGSFCNNKKIAVSNEINLNEMVCLVGDFCNPNLVEQQKIITKLSQNVKRIRMLGSSCVDNCYVASGKADVYIIFSSNMWDLLPGQFLVKQANGCIAVNKDKNIFISGNESNVDKIILLLKEIDDFEKQK